MVTGSIARRWAKALFLIGEEQGSLMGLVREVRRAADVWEVSEELRVALTNPLLAEKTRMAVLQATIRRIGVTRITKNFLLLLFEKSRLGQLPGIAMELQRMNDEKDNRLRAEVVSAAPLADEVVTRLKISMQKITGKKVVVTTRRDPELIGGIITKVGDLMYDGSIRTQLARMKEGMLGRG